METGGCVHKHQDSSSFENISTSTTTTEEVSHIGKYVRIGSFVLALGMILGLIVILVIISIVHRLKKAALRESENTDDDDDFVPLSNLEQSKSSDLHTE